MRTEGFASFASSVPKMSSQRYLKGECSHCGGHLEFPVESTGLTADCPHCGQPTDLLLAVPKSEPTIPRKTLVWTGVAVVILILGLGGAIVALQLAQKRIARQKEQTEQAAKPAAAVDALPDPNDPAVKAEFRASDIKLEKAAGSSLVYAVGTLTNASARQRFGVKVSLDLFDAAGRKLGTAQDYQGALEARAEWRFKAMVVEQKAASAKIAAIEEQQ